MSLQKEEIIMQVGLLQYGVMHDAKQNLNCLILISN